MCTQQKKKKNLSLITAKKKTTTTAHVQFHPSRNLLNIPGISEDTVHKSSKLPREYLLDLSESYVLTAEWTTTAYVLSQQSISSGQNTANLGNVLQTERKKNLNPLMFTK